MATEREIWAMDGEALVRLAFDLGLAPEGASYWVAEGDWAYDFGHAEPWEPHIQLVQTDAVLRTLRAQGWDTHVQYFAATGTGQVGVWRRDAENKLRGDLVQWQGERPEAEAILRCCCLAVASMREGA